MRCEPCDPLHIFSLPEYIGMSGLAATFQISEVILMCNNNGICSCFSGNNWWWIIILLLIFCNCGGSTGGCGCTGNTCGGYNGGCGNTYNGGCDNGCGCC